MQPTDGLTGRIGQQQAIAVLNRASFGPQPSLADLIDDALTRTVMAADRVERSDLEALLEKARAQLFLLHAASSETL